MPHAAGVNANRVAALSVALGFVLAAIAAPFRGRRHPRNPGTAEPILMSSSSSSCWPGSITGPRSPGRAGVLQSVGAVLLGPEAADGIVFVVMIAGAVRRRAGSLGQAPRAMIRAHLLRWRPRPPAQRTESTPRRRPSGAASHLDPSHRSSWHFSDRLLERAMGFGRRAAAVLIARRAAAARQPDVIHVAIVVHQRGVRGASVITAAWATRPSAHAATSRRAYTLARRDEVDASARLGFLAGRGRRLRPGLHDHVKLAASTSVAVSAFARWRTRSPPGLPRLGGRRHRQRPRPCLRDPAEQPPRLLLRRLAAAPAVRLPHRQAFDALRLSRCSPCQPRHRGARTSIGIAAALQDAAFVAFVLFCGSWARSTATIRDS